MYTIGGFFLAGLIVWGLFVLLFKPNTEIQAIQRQRHKSRLKFEARRLQEKIAHEKLRQRWAEENSKH